MAPRPTVETSTCAQLWTGVGSGPSGPQAEKAYFFGGVHTGFGVEGFKY